MSITVPNSGSAEQGSASLTFVYTLLFTPTGGRTLLVAVSGNNGQVATTYTVADNTGGGNYTQETGRANDTVLNSASILFRRDNIPSGITTITITCSASTFMTIAVWECAGSQSSGSFDVAAAGATGNSASAQPGSFTPTTGDAAFTTITHNGGDSSTLTTATSGWSVLTKQESTAGMPICVIQNLNTSGAQNPTTSIQFSHNWTDAGASYKPAPVVADPISGSSLSLAQHRPVARARARAQL